jgi:hypothetical protein
MRSKGASAISRAGQAVEGGEDQALGPVLAQTRDLILLEHAEGLGRIVRPLGLGRVEDIEPLLAGEPVLDGEKASSSGTKKSGCCGIDPASLLRGERGDDLIGGNAGQDIKDHPPKRHRAAS